MIQISIDDEKLGSKCSHFEIRKRKDKIVVVEIPKGHTVEEIETKDC